jgi:sugar O-acyltransferase (sialic acid O-acetyltransferase NeuD family)
VSGNFHTGVLIGYSGHGYVVAESAASAGLPLRYYIDLRKVISDPFGLEFLAQDVDMDFRDWDKGYHFMLGIGNNTIRLRIARALELKKQLMPPVIDSAAAVSATAQIGAGVFISKGACINAMAVVGSYSIINTAAIVEHECIIGSAVHIAPGSVLAGNVKVGDRSFIGANAVIKQGVVIGQDVTVGAGAVILKDIGDNATMVGNPAKQIR